jgi:hypothetical protein
MEAVNCFFDESGKFADHDVISFGGVGAPALNFGPGWAVDWKHCLTVNGLEMLTVKEAFRSHRPLSDKNPALGVEKRVEALLPFVACIRKHLQLVSGVAINVKAFKELPSHYFQILGSDPFFTAFLRTMLRFLEAVTEGDRVSLVCDDEEEMAIPMFKLYRQLKRVYPGAKDKLTSISFADDRALYGLQAADLVSSLMRREADKRFFGKEYDYAPMFGALTQQPQAFENIWGMETAFADRETLIKIADALKKS